ncbi:hypothetical protein B0H67DRAFT_653330 [Lasiosphaeris hirsuta]|uniref:MYND-type domain-containing protein n=1 Tax=Lasiosphaeris hirsuta TaxID=260670 RepID=A0AA40BAV3_9PEZI|nr:hypothetical protein B0H67DRAFT_653330 [Lasiosphaeris hirsuta]
MPQEYLEPSIRILTYRRHSMEEQAYLQTRICAEEAAILFRLQRISGAAAAAQDTHLLGFKDQKSLPVPGPSLLNWPAADYKRYIFDPLESRIVFAANDDEPAASFLCSESSEYFTYTTGIISAEDAGLLVQFDDEKHSSHSLQPETIDGDKAALDASNYQSEQVDVADVADVADVNETSPSSDFCAGDSLTSVPQEETLAPEDKLAPENTPIPEQTNTLEDGGYGENLGCEGEDLDVEGAVYEEDAAYVEGTEGYVEGDICEEEAVAGDREADADHGEDDAGHEEADADRTDAKASVEDVGLVADAGGDERSLTLDPCSLRKKAQELSPIVDKNVNAEDATSLPQVEKPSSPASVPQSSDPEQAKQQDDFAANSAGVEGTAPVFDLGSPKGEDTSSSHNLPNPKDPGDSKELDTSPCAVELEQPEVGESHLSEVKGKNYAKNKRKQLLKKKKSEHSTEDGDGAEGLKVLAEVCEEIADARDSALSSQELDALFLAVSNEERAYGKSPPISGATSSNKPVIMAVEALEANNKDDATLEALISMKVEEIDRLIEIQEKLCKEYFEAGMGRIINIRSRKYGRGDKCPDIDAEQSEFAKNLRRHEHSVALMFKAMRKLQPDLYATSDEEPCLKINYGGDDGQMCRGTVMEAFHFAVNPLDRVLPKPAKLPELCANCLGELQGVPRCYGRCKDIYYCSEYCQWEDYKVHKVLCNTTTLQLTPRPSPNHVRAVFFPQKDPDIFEFELEVDEQPNKEYMFQLMDAALKKAAKTYGLDWGKPRFVWVLRKGPKKFSLAPYIRGIHVLQNRENNEDRSRDKRIGTQDWWYATSEDLNKKALEKGDGVMNETLYTGLLGHMVDRTHWAPYMGSVIFVADGDVNMRDFREMADSFLCNPRHLGLLDVARFGGRLFPAVLINTSSSISQITDSESAQEGENKAQAGREEASDEEEGPPEEELAEEDRPPLEICYLSSTMNFNLRCASWMGSSENRMSIIDEGLLRYLSFEGLGGADSRHSFLPQLDELFDFHAKEKKDPELPDVEYYADHGSPMGKLLMFRPDGRALRPLHVLMLGSLVLDTAREVAVTGYEDPVFKFEAPDYRVLADTKAHDSGWIRGLSSDSDSDLGSELDTEPGSESEPESACESEPDLESSQD